MTQKTVPGLRFIASYSGGKDSVLAIHRAIQSGMILQALIITYNTDRGRSWFHGIEEDILRDISESVGAPVLLIRTSGADYAKNFEAMLREQRALGAEACVFGDIDIEGHLEWCSERCRSAGLIPCFPLWQENRRALAEECIRSGFRPTITVVDTRRLDASFAGRPLTLETLDEMERAGIDSCGENGEYHSFVSDGPIFSRPVPVCFGPAAVMDGYAIAPVRLRSAPVLSRARVQAYTGNGKGKTTAALGLMLRVAGAGMKCYFGQFMKSGEMSEITALRSFLAEAVTVEQYGSGKELMHPDLERDAACAKSGYMKARQALSSGCYDLVVLDEIFVAAHLKLLSDKDILQLIEERPSHTELVLTGRYASESVLQKADLVTKMDEIRHYFHEGLAARIGIEK